MPDHERKVVSSNAVITTGILLLVFAIAGTTILSIFGVTISSFMIAVGILLFIVAIEILTRGEWTFGNPRTITNLERESLNMVNDLLPNTDNESGGESRVVPLAFPLLARPGANFSTDFLSIKRPIDLDPVNCNCRWSYHLDP